VFCIFAAALEYPNSSDRPFLPVSEFLMLWDLKTVEFALIELKKMERVTEKWRFWHVSDQITPKPRAIITSAVMNPAQVLPRVLSSLVPLRSTVAPLDLYSVACCALVGSSFRASKSAKQERAIQIGYNGRETLVLETLMSALASTFSLGLSSSTR